MGIRKSANLKSGDGKGNIGTKYFAPEDIYRSLEPTKTEWVSKDQEAQIPSPQV